MAPSKFNLNCSKFLTVKKRHGIKPKPAITVRKQPHVKQSSSPTAKLETQPSDEWVQDNHERLVCILSCNFKKRREMAAKAVAGFVKAGARIVLFVPHSEAASYRAAFESPRVKLVTYSLTSPGKMFVGHSRNAILVWVKQYLNVLRTCTVSDERVYALTAMGKAPAETRTDVGTQRFWAIKEYMAGKHVEPALVKTLGLKTTFKEFSEKNIKLTAISDFRRNRNRKYKNPLARNPTIAQLITFAVGPNGWNGQFWYPETTMGEDIFFANKFSRVVGGVAECRSVVMLRTKGATLTRTIQDLSTYSRDNLKQVAKLFTSKAFCVDKGRAMLRWTKDSQTQPLVNKTAKYMYAEMHGMIGSLVAEADKRGIALPSSVHELHSAAAM
jgi:hypothetical protein